MKFNLKHLFSSQTVKNHEGAVVHPLTPELELYTAVVTSALQATFYEKDTTRLNRIQKLIAQVDPVFVAQLAVYARTKMYLRTVPLVLTVELAKVHTGTDLVSKMVKGVVNRADEITELLAYYQLANTRTGIKKLNRLSKQIQKGLSFAFNKFDAYQFAKYNRDGAIKLRDALFLTHPKAKDEHQQDVFNKIASNTLETPYTWETELSALGQQYFETESARKKAVKAKWEELILSEKLGYMALLRNLRNILEAQVDAFYIQKVCALLSNKDAVLKAKQFPFRFLSAYRELKVIKSKYTSSILESLEQAVQHTATTIKGFGFETSVVIACDVSGSMQFPISPKSSVLGYDIGLMLGMLLQNRCKTVTTGLFGDRWKAISVPKTGILANVQEFYRREGEVGYSTNGHLVIQDLIHRKEVVDKVFLFTDVQLYNSKNTNSTITKVWHTYKSTIAPHSKLYLFDLKGYGTSPFHVAERDVYTIAGWSDKVFEILDAVEQGASAVSEIKRITLN